MTLPGWPAPIDDVPKAVLAALLVAVAALALWGTLDRRSRGAALARRACRLSGWPGRVLLGVLAATVLFVVAEDVTEREEDEWVRRLDHGVRETALGLAANPGVRTAAQLVSGVTGEGLVLIVGTAVVALGATRRVREAATVLGGSLGAWLLAGGLKLAFGVARPNARAVRHAITSYGFPSAHALVTVAACGLLAWAAGLGASPGVRFALYGAAGALAVSAAAARLLLDRHWLSDVVTGLVVGGLWLNLVTLAATSGETRAHRAPP